MEEKQNTIKLTRVITSCSSWRHVKAAKAYIRLWCRERYCTEKYINYMTNYYITLLYLHIKHQEDIKWQNYAQ